MANEVTISVGARDNASATIEKVKGNARGLGSVLSGVAKVASGFLVAEGLMSLPGLLTGAAKAAAEDEAATLRLNKSLENLVDRGGAAGKGMADLTRDMNARIAAGQKLAFSDDDIRGSMEKLIAATDDYEESAKRQALAMDLARGANIPLADASKLLGKINEENVEVFKRMGITIGDNATEAEALAAVQAKFGGQADAYAQSTAGQFEQAKIRMSEVTETIGAAVLPVMTKLGNILIDEVFPRIESFANAVGPVLGRIGAWINDNVLPRLREFGEFFQAEIQPRLQQFADFTGEKFREFSAYYEENIAPTVEAIVEGIKWVVGEIAERWPQIEAIIRPVLEQVGAGVKFFVELVLGYLNILIKLITGDFRGAWEGMKDQIKRTVTFIVETLERGVELIKGVFSLYFDLGKDLIGQIIAGITSRAGGIGSALQAAIPGGALLGPAAGVLSGIAGDIPGFAAGGIVPGPVGAPQLAVVHGGEQVVPAGRGAGTTVNIYGDVYGIDDLVKKVGDGFNQAALTGGPILSSGVVQS